MDMDERIGERSEWAYDTLFAGIVQMPFLNGYNGNLYG